MTASDPLWIRTLWPEVEPRSPLAGPVVAPGEAEAYARAAYTAEVASVAQAIQGTRNATLNKAGFNLFQLVPTGHLRYEDVWGGLHDAALSSGLTEAETSTTLGSAARAGMRLPRQVPEQTNGQDVPEVTVLEEADDTAVHIDWPEHLDWHDLWVQADDEEEWIVEPILPARRLVALYSPAKTGKSLLMLEMAVGIARGITVLDYRPDRPHRVLYVDLENDPRGDIRTRLQHMGQKPDDLENLLYLSFPSLPMLDTALGAARLLEVVEHFGCEVVVIDTISRLVSGEENDNDTWLAFYRHTGRALKAAGITCVRLDHTGKDLSRGMRGGSAKYSDVDLVWSLTRPTDDTLKLECTAQRVPVRERVILLHRKVDPWLHHVVYGEGRKVAWSEEQDEAIRFLDAIHGDDAPITLSKAQKTLKDNGRGRRRAMVGELLRKRNEALAARGLAYPTEES